MVGSRQWQQIAVAGARALLHHHQRQLFPAAALISSSSIRQQSIHHQLPRICTRFICSSQMHLAASKNDCETDSDLFEGLYFEGEIPRDRIKQKWSNASGPGGQNVNKNPTKAEIRFSIPQADWIPERVRDRLVKKFPAYVNSRQEFLLTSQITRSPLENMDDCFKKLHVMLLDCSQELVEEAQRAQISPEYLKLLAERKEKADEWRLEMKKRNAEKRRYRQNDKFF